MAIETIVPGPAVDMRNAINNNFTQVQVLSGSGSPTTATVGVIGQFYVDTTSTGVLWRCTAISGTTYTWNKPAAAYISYDNTTTGISATNIQDAVDYIVSTPTSPFVISASAPSSTVKFWIDTGNNNILKYYNGSAWTAVSVAWGS